MEIIGISRITRIKIKKILEKKEKIMMGFDVPIISLGWE